MAFPCAQRKANATTANRTGTLAVTRTVSYAPEELVDLSLTLHRHLHVSMCIDLCLLDSRIDRML